MTTTTVTATDPLHWMPDYCPRCNPSGHHADRCTRDATLTEPDALTWDGGRRLILEYTCDSCGHHWRRADLWGAREAGFDPSNRKAAA